MWSHLCDAYVQVHHFVKIGEDQVGYASLYTYIIILYISSDLPSPQQEEQCCLPF